MTNPFGQGGNAGKASIVALVLVALICCGCCCGASAVQSLHAEDLTITVCDLRDQSTSDGHTYLVFAIDMETGVNVTFKMEDGLRFGPFQYRTNTSDAWGSLSKGAMYDVTATGWRVSWASEYQNLFIKGEVTDATPATCPTR